MEFGKRGTYRGMWCDSSWELAYAIYCVEHGMSIIRNERKFPYRYKGKVAYWIPDFIVNGKFVEIKGYEPARDRAKIRSFKYPLTVIREQEMKPILSYVTNKYGVDYTNLYDD
jgi:hypothetical protein